jgi:hypothetical protein
MVIGVSDLLKRPDVWISLVVAIVAAILAGPLWRFAKSLLLFLPSRVARSFGDMWGHFGKLNRAKGDAAAASAYIGFQLSQLIVHAVLLAIAWTALQVLQALDARWVWSPHGVLLGVLVAALLVCAFRIAKRAFLLFTFYTLLMNPTDLSKPTKIGNVEIGPFKPTDATTSATPTAASDASKQS